MTRDRRLVVPEWIVAENAIAAAVTDVQGFTALGVRYRIAEVALDALLELGWQPPAEASSDTATRRAD